MKSAVLIVPKDYLAVANSFAASMGWGPNNYSVALSPTGTGVSTHYGCRANVSQTFLDLLANPPAQALPILAVVHIDISDTTDFAGHFHSVLDQLSLSIIESTGEN